MGICPNCAEREIAGKGVWCSECYISKTWSVESNRRRKETAARQADLEANAWRQIFPWNLPRLGSDNKPRVE